ncbi:MAG: hypothetical protein ABI091_27330, partial [Ferruginibacter sp.]
MLNQLFSTAIVMLLVSTGNAQLKEVLKQKAGEGVRQGTQNSTERILDKGVDKLFAKKDKKNKSEEKSNTQSEDKTYLQNQPSPKTYGKYDFIPGAKILGYDDFSNDAVGDFPAKWTTNA